MLKNIFQKKKGVNHIDTAMAPEEIAVHKDIYKALNDRIITVEQRMGKFEAILHKYVQVVDRIINGPIKADAPQNFDTNTSKDKSKEGTPVITNRANEQVPQLNMAVSKISVDNVPKETKKKNHSSQRHPLYKKANEKDFFILEGGMTLTNTVELLSALKEMDDTTFSGYVNSAKNDFSTWL